MSEPVRDQAARSEVEVKFWLSKVTKAQSERDRGHRALEEALRRADRAGATDEELDGAQEEERRV